ncbi:hypothetical protein V8F33_003695 [Rhypophila sp. PSN 637]
MITNRAESIDRAFQSRIHLTLQYPDLAPEAQQHMWRQLIGETKDKTNASRILTVETYCRLAQLALNGRQIKNAVMLATLLATQEGSDLGLGQIRTVLMATGDAGNVDI